MKQFSIYLGVAALASALFLVAPEIDLATSWLFYDAKGGFVLSDWPPVVVLYRAVPLISRTRLRASWLRITSISRPTTCWVRAARSATVMSSLTR